MLTKKQQLLLQFIHERLQAEGVPPSFEEMKEALDLKSKSGIHRLITALEERGFIRRLPNRARALEVIKMPESWGSNDMGTSAPPVVVPAQQTANDNVALAGTNSNPGSERSRTAMAAKNQQFAANRQSANDSANDNAGFEVPVMGKIAAGVPIAAIQHETHSVMVPPGMIGTGEHYALTIEGDSMIEAGIHDGDTVIIRQSDTARAGEIVVALVDDEEATLKTFRRDGQDIVLEAANPAHENRRYPANRVQVQGKLVGLIRQYH